MKKIIVISGPSGVGKTTLYKRLLKEFPDKLDFSISATTRQKRENEVDGVDYYFISKENFEKLIKEDAFVEWAKVYENYYGTLKSEIERISDKNKWCLLDVDVQGGMNVKRVYPESHLIFILPPDMDELKRRIIERNLDSEKEIAIRLSRAEEEMRYSSFYDYNIVNDDLERAYRELRSLVLKIIEKS
jgi:guanylate kinase